MNRKQLAAELKRRFPWLDSEENADGADTVDALSDWYQELKDADNH